MKYKDIHPIKSLKNWTEEELKEHQEKFYQKTQEIIKKEKEKEKKKLNFLYKDLEEKIKKNLGTKVTISAKDEKKGKINKLPN